MKKILSFVAIVAVLLGMASCNKKDDVKVQKFKITVEDIDETSAYITVEAPTEDMMYKVIVMPKNVFDYVDLPHNNEWMDVWEESYGNVDFKADKLYPGNKYVVGVIEWDADGNYVGEMESVNFRTKEVEYEWADTPNGEPIPFVGGLYDYPEYDNITSYGDYEIEEEGITVELVLRTVGHRKTGHFTTDDLYNFHVTFCYMESDDLGGESEVIDVSGADYNVTYDEATQEYHYEGWVDLLEGTHATRLPFTMTCTEQ